ncbi:MAG: hypothetical protein HY347_09380 [candidate division NC10 bacterium]|nr:hypothetical protein [candidate division NC10 bacterium]
MGRWLVLGGLFCLTLLKADVLLADVLYESDIRIKDALVRGAIEIEQHQTVSLKDAMRREELVATRTVTTRRGTRYARELHRVILQRLDEGVTSDVDVKTGTYTEEGFADELTRKTREIASAEDALKTVPEGVTRPLRVSVKPTGETKPLSGYECRRYLLTAEVEAESPRGGGLQVYTVTWDLWVTDETDWSKEIRTLDQKIAERSGEDGALLERQMRIFERRSDLFAKFSLATLRLGQEQRKLRGFPMKWEQVLSGPAGAASSGVLFHLTGEITNLRLGPLKDDAFQLPPGLTKIGM